MKTHLAKVSLALLSTVFLFGCQEQGSEPVGPGPEFDKPDATGNHKHDKDDDGGGGGNAVAATLTLADGMLTKNLPVTVRANKLGADYTDFTREIQMDFTAPGVCFGFQGTKSSVLPSNDEVALLVAELHDFSETHGDEDLHTPGHLVREGFFTMQIDENSLGAPSGDNLLLVEFDGTFDDEEGTTHGFTRIMLGSPFNQVDPVTVTRVSENVFEFTGPVVVWAHGVGGGGGVKSDRIIACDGLGDDPNNPNANPNKVVATIIR